MSNQSVVKKKLREVKYEYLKDQGHVGGDAYGYHVVVQEWIEANKSLILQDAVILASQIASKVWGEKLSLISHDQMGFELNGDPLPMELKYKKEVASDDGENETEEDSNSKNCYITVLTQYADLKQFRMAYMEIQENANEQTAAADKMLKQYKAMMKMTNGQEQTLIQEALALLPEPTD